jgi:tRNA dimethylallyltransferase
LLTLSNHKNKKLIVIAGPTAVGKTGVAVRLGAELHTEIISADARQIYKELEIGTAKPTAAELAAVPHHFISSHSIHDDYNAAVFGEEALALIRKLFTTHDRVILCGGSGLYIKAVLEGFDDAPPVATEIREAIVEEYNKKGLAWLQGEVQKHDPEFFEIVDQKNPHRLIRALEIGRATGIKMGDWRKRSKHEHDFDVVKIGLTLPMEELYTRIDSRVDQMIADGLFEEAEHLYPFSDLQALQTVGYREIFAYMDQSYDREEAIRLLKRNTRHYAKRQMTWFRKDLEFTWLQPPAPTGSQPDGRHSVEARSGQWNEIVNLAGAS